MNTKVRLAATGVGIVLAVVVGFFAIKDASSSGNSSEARSTMTIIAPAAAGGGWDLGAREFQQATRTDGIVNNSQVVNIPGASGTIGLRELTRFEGDPTRLMFMGGTLIGGVEMGGSSVGLDDVTPIAKLTEDYLVIAVSEDSEWETLDDFLDAWREDPTIPIGGGSTGSPDHLVGAQLAKEIGIEPEDVHFAPHSGGGDLTLSLLSTADATVPIGVSGYNDFRDLIDGGRLRPLAVVAPERIDVLADTPTTAELGYEGVNIVNWRGVVAPPGLSDEERDELVEITEEMAETESWREAMARNGWQDSWAGPDEFAEYIREETEMVRNLLIELSLI